MGARVDGQENHILRFVRYDGFTADDKFVALNDDSLKKIGSS
jgi:hypothetical protein